MTDDKMGDEQAEWVGHFIVKRHIRVKPPVPIDPVWRVEAKGYSWAGESLFDALQEAVEVLGH